MADRDRASIFCKLCLVHLFMLVGVVFVTTPVWMMRNAQGWGGMIGPRAAVVLCFIVVFGLIWIRLGRYLYRLFSNQIPRDELPILSSEKRIAVIAKGGVFVVASWFIGGFQADDLVHFTSSVFCASLGLSMLFWGIHDAIRSKHDEVALHNSQIRPNQPN